MNLPAGPRAHILPRSIVTMLFALASCADPSSPATAPDLSPAVEAKAPAPQNIPVATTISNTDANGALLTRSDNASGSSASYSGGVIVAGGGAWQLYLGNQSARTVWLTLAGQGIAGIPDGYYSANVEVYSQCFADANGTTASDLTAMTNGVSNSNCSFGVDFASGGTKYKLAMSPKYAGTGHATVTCVAPATGACTTWTVASDPSANVARLFKFARNGSLSAMGDYHNTYAVTFSR